MSDVQESIDGLTPETDPVNHAPKTEQGYPIRLHARGGEVRYTKSEADREFLMHVDRRHLQLQELINAPWWKRLWMRFNPEL